MKPILNLSFVLIVIFLFSSEGQAQKVGINTVTPDSSAMLDVVSTSKGMLVPRMTTAQRIAIPIPAAGLLVFDTDTQSFWFRNATSWINLLTSLTGWSLTGNNITYGDFIGTTNLQPLRLKVNNLDQLILNDAGAIQRDEGGDYRGAEAVDLQKSRYAFDQVASGSQSAILGGFGNRASGPMSTVAGGLFNTVSSLFSNLGGGLSNTISGEQSVISGGNNNMVSGLLSTIGGGASNVIMSNFSVIPGGKGLSLGVSARGTLGFMGGNTNSMNNMTVNDSNTVVFGNANLWLANNNGNSSTLRFYEANNTLGDFPAITTNYTSFRAAAQTTDLNYILPGTKTATNSAKEVLLQLDTITNQMSWLNSSLLTGWSLTGNTGTIPGTNFIGTTDMQAFRLRSNNIDQLILNPNGSIQRDAGGNPRGQYAVDMQNSRINASYVAAGILSVIGGGENNYANGTRAVISGGDLNYADASGSVICGGSNNANFGAYSTIIGGRGLQLQPGANWSFGFLGGSTATSMYINQPNTGVFGNTDLWLANNDNSASQLRFYEANNTIGLFPPATINYTSLSAGVQTTDLNYILPLSKIPTNTIEESVLQIDTATNQMSWINTSAFLDWSRTGNSGTTVGTNFIGTTDDEPLMFRVNLLKSGYIDYDGTKANTCFGYGTLSTIGLGTGNTATGYSALAVITSGNNNTANGYNALGQNSSGNSNSAFGAQTMLGLTTGSKNTAVGYQSLYFLSTGINNTSLGYNANLFNSAGNRNVAVGAEALQADVAGSETTAIGSRAMYYANSTSTPHTSRNVAVGFEALRGSTTAGDNTGFANTAVGTFSLLGNSSGTNNVAVGFNALSSNTTGGGNTALGNRALNSVTTNSNLVAVGDSSLYANTGYDNTAVGSRSLRSNIGGFNNTAVGRGSLYSNTSGSYNTAVGYMALKSNITAHGNTAFGYDALFSNVSGGDNTAIGYLALSNVTATGSSSNVAVGTLTLKGSAIPANNTGTSNTAVGGFALTNFTTGSRNTAIGRNAFTDISSGSDNTALGYNAGLSGATNNKVTLLGANTGTTVDNLTNATAIGYNAAVASSNSLVLGGTGVDAVNVGIGTTSPGTSSILELSSTTKAFVLPRMTKAQRDAITPKIAGMAIYQTDNTPGLRVYNGTNWMRYTETAD